MKRKTLLTTLFITLLAVTFLFGSFTPMYAKKKTRPVDKLKYPALNEIKMPDILKADIGNGIKLRLIKDDKLPLVTIRVILKGGDAYDPKSKVGLTDITAQLLRIGGTKDLKPEDLDKQLDANGISISFSTTTDMFYISLTCLKENLDQSLTLLAKMLRQPAFNDEKLEELKTKLGTSISRRNDTPATINSREFSRLIYGNQSPFAAVLEYEHLENITKNDIMMVYRTFFAPDNMMVGVVGPVEIKELKQLFDKHLGSWQAKSRVPVFPTVKEQKHDFKVAFANKSNLNQSYLSIGHIGVTTKQEERAKILVFNSIFSQGFSSRLMNRIRARMGLTYGVRGGIGSNYIYPGVTSFSTFTKSESTVKAIKAMQEEIANIGKELVTNKELQDAKNYFLNSFVFRYSSPAQILMSSLRKEFYGVPSDADKKLQEDIKKISVNDVLETAKKYLHPDKMVIFVVGNEKELKGSLDELGKVKKIDIEIKPPALKEKIPAATPETLAKGQKLMDALIAKQYKGYKKLKSVVTTSTLKMTMQGRSFEMGIKSSVEYPGKIHMEISVMGMKMTRIINDKKGIFNQMGQQKPISEKEIEDGLFADLYDIVHSKDKYKFQYLKEEKIEGKTYDVLYIFDAKKNWAKFFVNRATGLIEMEEKLDKSPGQTGISRTIKSGLKTIKGIPFFFNSKTFNKDKLSRELMVKEIKVNSKIDSAIFNLDKKK
jgi:zinc protease